jgi:hypothetical protein
MGAGGGWLSMAGYEHLADFLRTLCGLDSTIGARTLLRRAVGPPRLHGPVVSGAQAYPCCAGADLKCNGSAGGLGRSVDNRSGFRGWSA